MIRLYRIVGLNSQINWVLGAFADEKHALDEYNSEVRRALSEHVNDNRPLLDFAEPHEREAEFFLCEEEVTHTPVGRDEAMETGRWGLIRASRP